MRLCSLLLLLGLLPSIPTTVHAGGVRSVSQTCLEAYGPADASVPKTVEDQIRDGEWISNVRAPLTPAIVKLAKKKRALLLIYRQSDFREGFVGEIRANGFVLLTAYGPVDISFVNELGRTELLTRAEPDASYRTRLKTLKSELTPQRLKFLKAAESALAKKQSIRITTETRKGIIRNVRTVIGTVISVQSFRGVRPTKDSVGHINIVYKIVSATESIHGFDGVSHGWLVQDQKVEGLLDIQTLEMDDASLMDLTLEAL